VEVQLLDQSHNIAIALFQSTKNESSNNEKPLIPTQTSEIIELIVKKIELDLIIMYECRNSSKFGIIEKGTYGNFVKRNLRLEVNVITRRRKSAFHR